MEFSIEHGQFADAVAWAARALPARPAAAILGAIRLVTSGQGVTISAFDYEQSATADIPAQIAQPATALVPGRLLADITRVLPARPIQISANGTTLALACGGFRYTLHTMPADGYPAPPDLPPAVGTVDASLLAAAVAQVAVAAGRDDTLPFLTGIRLELGGETLRLIATDRYRLAVREIDWKAENPDFAAVALIPAKALHDITKALGATGPVTLALSAQNSSPGEGLIGFESGHRRCTTRLLDGEFIKYDAVFPAQYTGTAVIETAALIEAVKAIALVAEHNTPIRLRFSTGQLTLEAAAADQAQASVTIEAAFEGEDISIAPNPAYLLDGLSALDAPYVELAYTTSTKPAVLTGRSALHADHDPSYRYLFLPLRA